MHRDYVGEPFEVAGVEGKDLLDAVRLHDRGEPRIVYLCASHLVLHDETTPYAKRIHRIRQHRKKRLDARG
jgi:hypothetical protein